MSSIAFNTDNKKGRRKSEQKELKKEKMKGRKEEW